MAEIIHLTPRRGARLRLVHGTTAIEARTPGPQLPIDLAPRRRRARPFDRAARRRRRMSLWLGWSLAAVAFGAILLNVMAGLIFGLVLVSLAGLAEMMS